MAKNTVDSCMFCMQNPCQCGKPAKKTPAKKALPKVERVRPTPVPTRTQPPSNGTVGEVGPGAPIPPMVRASGRPNLSDLKRVRDPEEEELCRAVTCLADADMLHRDELVKHRGRIRLPPHRVDAMIWKQDIREKLR